MDADFSKSITHGVASGLTKIRSVSVMIINDAGTQLFPLNTNVSSATVQFDGGVGDISSSSITLIRLTGGFFDGVGFDSVAGYNRGYVTILYAE